MLRTIYGFDDLGRKVPMGSYDDGLKAVGGRIFYIDSSSDETVKFYDSSFNELSNVAVGDTPSYYKVTSAGISGKEKFYVYNSSISDNDKYWGYLNVDTGITSRDIGYGKTNTSTILSIEDTSQYANDSIWNWLKTQRISKLGDCNDWFIGSEYELEQLRLYLAANADGETIIDFFTNKSVWNSSVTYEPTIKARLWSQTTNEWTSAGRDSHLRIHCCAIRSF